MSGRLLVGILHALLHVKCLENYTTQNPKAYYPAVFVGQAMFVCIIDRSDLVR